jgi:hypothetical protein
MGSRKVICMFCDQLVARSREDVVPQLLAGELGGTAPFLNDRYTLMHGQLLAARSKKVGSFAALKVPRVCAQCNNGWMARMEDRVRPVVSPLVRRELPSVRSAPCPGLAAADRLPHRVAAPHCEHRAS